ncbi:hypothetical protein ACRAWF_31920 [Streptomyces sp. L7]
MRWLDPQEALPRVAEVLPERWRTRRIRPGRRCCGRPSRRCPCGMDRVPAQVMDVARELAVSERQLRNLFTDGVGALPSTTPVSTGSGPRRSGRAAPAGPELAAAAALLRPVAHDDRLPGPDGCPAPLVPDRPASRGQPLPGGPARLNSGAGNPRPPCDAPAHARTTRQAQPLHLRRHRGRRSDPRPVLHAEPRRCRGRGRRTPAGSPRRTRHEAVLHRELRPIRSEEFVPERWRWRSEGLDRERAAESDECPRPAAGSRRVQCLSA